MGSRSTRMVRAGAPLMRDIEVMVASPAAAFSSDGWWFELKYDGFRLVMGRQGGAVRLLTRKRVDATSWFPELVPAGAALPDDTVIDGEVCVLGEGGVPDFERIKRRGRSRARGAAQDPVVLFAFDLMVLRGRDVRAHPIERRRQQLQRVVAAAGHPRLALITWIEREGKVLYDYAISLGMEGIVAKRAGSAYVGGRSKDWLKCKPAGFHDGWRRPLARR